MLLLCAIGPWPTRDEVPDPQNPSMTLSVDALGRPAVATVKA
jgi:hypothetical protein